jgi:hypothetical protein
MQFDYSQSRPYSTVTYSLNRRRQVVDAVLQELYAQHEQMIEQALAMSDLSQARAVIDHVRTL